MKRLVENPRLLLLIALYSTTPPVAAVAACTMHDKDWQPMGWQSLLLMIGLLMYLMMFVFMPIMIVLETHFPRKKKDDAVQGS